MSDEVETDKKPCSISILGNNKVFARSSLYTDNNGSCLRYFDTHRMGKCGPHGVLSVVVVALATVGTLSDYYGACG